MADNHRVKVSAVARGKRPEVAAAFLPSFLASSQPDASGFTRQRLVLTFLSHSEGAGRVGRWQLEAGGGVGVIWGAAAADSSK